MIHTKVKCPVCGDVVQEGRTDYFCRSYAFGGSCGFRVSKKQNAVTKMSGRTLDIQIFLKLLQPAGLTVPIQDKRYQFQIITKKKREWEIIIRAFKSVKSMGEKGRIAMKEKQPENQSRT